MTDRQVYERAVAEIQHCEKRIAELRAFVRVYEEFAGSAVTKGAGQSKPATTTARRKASGEMQDWERMVDAAIRQAGRPLRVREIYDAIVPMGFRVESDNPVPVLDTRLGRSPHFTKPTRGLYDRAEKSAGVVLSRQDNPTEADDDDEASTGEAGSTRAGELSFSLEQAAKGA